MSVARFHMCHFAIIKDFGENARDWAERQDYLYFFFLIEASEDRTKGK